MQNDAAAEALFGWWALAGVDSAVHEEPVNWLRPVAPSFADSVARTDAGLAIPQAIAPVMPATLPAFHDWLGNGAQLIESAWPSARLLPSGAANAGLMVICDMPDRQDAEQGQMLSGEAGRLFDAMLAAIGLQRDDIYLASLAIARPAGGLFNPADSAALAQRMRHHVKLVAPHKVLLLGEKTSRALLSADSASRDLGPANGLRTLNHDGGTVDAVATFHPRLLLLQPAAKAESWRALQNLIEGNRS